MSRTYRKRQESFNTRMKEGYYDVDLCVYGYRWGVLKRIPWTKARCKAEYLYGENWQHNTPQWYRNQVNRVRRAVDKRELYKEVNREDYVGNYDPWNCKSDNAWGYW